MSEEVYSFEVTEQEAKGYPGQKGVVTNQFGHTRYFVDPQAWKPWKAAFDQSEKRVLSSTGGEKGSKLERFDLIPVGPLTELARLYGKGAEKYAERNWEKGYDWNLSYASLLRHVTQFWAGEDNDAETGCPHMAAVAFHAFALLQFMERNREFDNRPKTKV